MGDSKTLKVDEALRKMIEDAGKSMYRVSLDLDHKPSYMSTTLNNLRLASNGDGPGMGVNTLMAIADVCGYDVALVPRGKGAPIRISCERGE